jgi:hypothetical protein
MVLSFQKSISALCVASIVGLVMMVVFPSFSWGYLLKDGKHGTHLSVFGLGMVRLNYASVDGNAAFFEESEDGFLEDLEPQKSIRLTYKVALDPKLEEALYLTAVKVYAMDRSGFPFETNEFELDVKVERAMVLDIRPHILEQEKGKQIQAGMPFTVNTSIKNIGSVAMVDSMLIVTLPEGMSYVQASSQINNTSVSDPIRDGQRLVWQLYDFPVGIQRTVQYKVYSRERIPGRQQITTEIQGTTETGITYQSKKHTVEVKFSED